MDHPSGRAAAIAGAAALLAVVETAGAAAGQARGSLAVTVRVVAQCGASLGAGGAAASNATCPAASRPLAILTESEPPPATSEPVPVVEGTGATRYVTLIY